MAPTVATSTGDPGAAERGPLLPHTRTWAPPRPRLAIAVLTAVVGLVPLAVAAVALRSPHWYPLSDLALIELRVRDVGTADTPLVGPPGPRLRVRPARQPSGADELLGAGAGLPPARLPARGR